MLTQFVPFALWRARCANSPEAEAIALMALIRAVVTFRSTLKSETDQNTPFPWIRLKIDFALRNLGAAYPGSDVRDAFISFEQTFRYTPTLKELSTFGPFNPRHVLNVWEQVAKELDLTTENDTVMQSLLHELADWFRCVFEDHSEVSYLVRRVLKYLSAAESCLLILKYCCGYSEQEILRFLNDARVAAVRGATQDDLEDQLDEFVSARIDNLKSPWDSCLLDVRSRGHLAIRLYRARARFRAISLRLNRNG